MKDNEAMDRNYVKGGHNYPQHEASDRSESKSRPFDTSDAGDQEEEWAVADVGNSDDLLVDFGQRRSNSASSGGISCEEQEYERTNEVVQPEQETLLIDSQQSSEESIHVPDNDYNRDMKNDDEFEINIDSISMQEVPHTSLLEQNVETMEEDEETNNEHPHINDMEENTMKMMSSISLSDDYDDRTSADNKVDIDGSQHRPLPEIFDAMKVLSEQPNLPDSIKKQLKQYMQDNTINKAAEQRRESTATERIIQRIDNSWNSHIQRQTEEQSTTTSSHSKSSLSLPTLNGLMDHSVSSSCKNFENNHYIEQNEEWTMKSLEETEASDIPKQDPKTENCDIYNPHLSNENEESLRNPFKNNAKHADLSLPSIQSHQRNCNEQQNPSKVCHSKHTHNESEEDKEESLRNSLMNSAKDSELSLGTVQSSHTTSSYMSTSAKLGFHVENIDDFYISSGPLLSRRLKKTRHIQTESESVNGNPDIQQGSPKTKKQVSSVTSISAESIANLPSFSNADRSRRGKTSRYSKHSKAARRDSGNSLINLDSSNHTSGRRLSNESSMDSSYHTYSSSRRRSVEHSRRHSNESRGSRGSRFDTRRFSNERDQGKYHRESDNLESVKRHSNDNRRVRDKSTDHSQRRFSNGKMRYGNESSQRSMSIPFASRPIEDRVSRSLHGQQRDMRSREMLSKTHHTHGGIADEINHDIDNDCGSVASADSMAMTVEFNGKSLTVKRKENLKEVDVEAVAMDLHAEIDDAISKLCEIGQSTRKRNKNPVDVNGLTYSMAPNTTVFKKTAEIRSLEYWLEHCREKIALSKVKEKRRHSGSAITVKNKAKFEYSLKKLYAKECQAENDIRHLLSNSNLPDSQDVLSSVCRAARLTRTLSEDFQRHIQVKPRKTPRRSSLDLRKSSMSIDIASHTKDQNVPSQSSFPRSLFRIISLFQGNEKCCDCAEGFRPSDKIWASISYGTLLCESCAMRHFNVQIKINLEEEEEVLKQIDKGTWDFVSIITMLEGGNKKMIDYMGTHDKSFKSLQTKTSKRKMSLVHSATVKGHATDDETSFKTIYSCKAAQSYRKDLAHRVSDSMSKDLKMFIH